MLRPCVGCDAPATEGRFCARCAEEAPTVVPGRSIVDEVLDGLALVIGSGSPCAEWR